jgi:MYXO-CTERM domain-containing protein
MNSGSANDANLRGNPYSGNLNTANSATSSSTNSSTDSSSTSTAESANSSSSNSGTGSSNNSSSSNMASSPSYNASNANTSTTPSQGTTSTSSDHSSEWGLFGLLGLVGLAGLARRTAPSGSYASDRLEQGLAQAQVGASTTWDRLATRVSQSRKRRAREKEIKRIKYALGRPSNRVILDRQDRVILNVGDLITNQAIEQARMANMLDVLLDSVDNTTPEIAEEERSAPVAGEASLEKHEQNVGFDGHQR